VDLLVGIEGSSHFVRQVLDPSSKHHAVASVALEPSLDFLCVLPALANPVMDVPMDERRCSQLTWMYQKLGKGEVETPN